MGVFAAMFWVSMVLFLGTLFSGSESQVVVMTQPASMSASLGSTVKIPCAPSSDFKISSDRVRWYQQQSGGTPRFLYHYYTSSDQGRGSGVPERFSSSPDSSKNLWNLVITGVQAEDEADYYCSTWDGRPSAYVFGGGTTLTVLGQPTVHPTVNVFPPSPEELKGDKATLVCLMDGFYPGVVQVTWEGDGTPISSGVETTKPSKLNDKYVASSYLSMTKNDWERYDEVTCKVTHEGKTFPKVVKRMECA